MSSDRARSTVQSLAAAAALSLAVLSGSAQAPSLRIVSASPTGELGQLADADQIRIIFSEPMIALGTPTATAAPPWLRLTPAGSRHFLLVGHQDAHLFSRAVDTAAVRDNVHGPRRCDGRERGGSRARGAVRAHVHDPHRSPVGGDVVSERRTLRQSSHSGLALQPAGASRRCAGARAGRRDASRLDRAEAVVGGTGPLAADGSLWPRALRCQGGRGSARHVLVGFGGRPPC